MITRRQFSIGSMLSVAGASFPLPRAFAQATPGGRPGFKAPTYYVPLLGQPAKYPKDFAHWDYVNPDAPKGGKLVLGAYGTFDTLNYFAGNGNAPSVLISAIYDSLLTSNADELGTDYADVAESLEFSEDGLSLICTMREGPRFHDGTPMTAADIVFTNDLFRGKSPYLKARFYGYIDKIEALDDRTVRFVAKNLDNPLILKIIAGMPILPKHWWTGRDFDSPIMEPLLGSGGRQISAVDPGRSFTLKRAPDYWGKDLPQNKGQSNFDEITYQYYRDLSVMYEALKSGETDFMSVTTPQEWVTGFKGVKGVETGALKMEEIPSEGPQSTGYLNFNLRRPLFTDVRVRRAFNYLFDFESTQKTSYYGMYKRPRAYFANTPFEFEGIPQGRELEILERYKGRIPDEVLTAEFTQPTTDGNGNIRANMRAAVDLLKQAGWENRDNQLVNTATGAVASLEIIYFSSDMEKTVLPFVQNLKRVGVQTTARLLDTAQFRQRLNEFQFDIMPIFWPAFYPPGQELRSFWNSQYADVGGSENSWGIKDPILDELIDLAIAADNWDEKVATCRALNRYAAWQFLSIGLYYDPVDRIAYWDMFGRPDTRPKYDVGFSTWWYSDHNPKALRGQRR
ncbi:MAG: ABC transporter substrate-binding protein [Inquilinus limosus]|uniref:ABC transporter substrate-binding protein n=1 Tax=Inquilinus limosus TaxID=171674 RepID=A0A952KGP4_9PROT|nr:ABC transporter substrate-binding protein [Inquilinus limosus]